MPSFAKIAYCTNDIRRFMADVVAAPVHWLASPRQAFSRSFGRYRIEFEELSAARTMLLDDPSEAQLQAEQLINTAFRIGQNKQRVYESLRTENAVRFQREGIKGWVAGIAGSSGHALLDSVELDHIFRQMKRGVAKAKPAVVVKPVELEVAHALGKRAAVEDGRAERNLLREQHLSLEKKLNTMEVWRDIYR